jgi:Yip1 domain
MDLVQRAKNICLTPKTEWPVIGGETTPTAELVTGYVLPLAAIGAVAGLIGRSLVGVTLPLLGTYRTPIVAGIGLAIFGLVMAVVAVFVIGFVINALAPTFGAEKNSAQALKVAVYAYTPGWVAGVLQIIPMLGILAVLAALYGLYLLYLGLPVLMKCPKEKAVGYTIVTVICAIVFSIVVGIVAAAIGGAGLMGAGAIGALGGSGGQTASATAQTAKPDPNSALGRLQALSNSLDQANQKMQDAQAKGDTAGQAAAAMQGLGALLGGGSRVEPVDIDQLKPLLPETFAGLARRSSKAEKNGVLGLSVSNAEAEYGDGNTKSVTLDISDSGGMSGLVAMAGWAGAEGEKEDANSSEKTTKENGRLVHEEVSKTGGTNEYDVVIGDRFVIGAKGDGVDINALKAAVAGLDLAKLESMKDAGVQK